MALAATLRELERRTPEARIELGLQRVRTVLDALSPDLAGRRVVTVAGTNGKGSTVSFIEAGLRAAGRRTLAYTSPHLLDFRERFRIDGQSAGAAETRRALQAVERARAATPLTYFEHVTLAALELAAGAGVDDLVLEVGLGGRLDAVNVVDADLAVITSIGLDHQEWLGRTRAKIAREKSGVARPGRPVIVAEPDPPEGMVEHLRSVGAELLAWGEAFDARWTPSGLSVRSGDRRLRALTPGLAGRHQRYNAAAAVVALERLGVDEASIRAGLSAARLTGRFERIGDDPATWADVAHNPAAARALRDTLEARPGRWIAVFAALADKDVAGIARAIAPVIDRWFVAELDGPRAVTAERLVQRLRHAGVSAPLDAVESVPVALERARAECRGDDEVIVFGSFLTAAAACRALRTG
ncbi:bifunctional folylpolyglutamate synthase/dihydrofolate synthase [Wenzhouxiangella sp. XN79A]|nr:bifunctional folylpolyglutamate synthase/dihydrofolate synthase [Wenzhouxiangella sp. XN79A]